MEKKMNNKGFSLVELIIVVAIMAVLIGVLAPAYLQYVEKSKKTTDASAIGSVLDAFEIVAADPAVNWAATDAAKSVTISNTAFNPNGDAVLVAVDNIVDFDDVLITGSWSSITFTAKKNTNGTVVFTIAGTSTIKKNSGDDGVRLDKISAPLANRFE